MENHFFTTGEFAKKANTSVRTIRYYDKQGLLKPSHVSDNGYRLYTDADFAKLQKIMTLKYLGFSLEEIGELTLRDQNRDYVRDSLNLQLKLVQNRIENLELVRESLEESARLLETDNHVDWDRMLQLIHMVNMEHTLADQYRNGENVDIRIRLHRTYSTNPVPWFAWIYDQLNLQKGMQVLEIGCGNGELWCNATDHLIPGRDFHLTLTDSSYGMIAAVRDRLQSEDICYQVCDCEQEDLPAAAGSLDRVIANHLLFYIRDRERLYGKVAGALRQDGIFVCSTYGQNHMKEMTDLVHSFDERISLSAISLYEVFGLENGEKELSHYFGEVTRVDYCDTLKVSDADPLVDYILSCHGNQHEFLKDRMEEFRRFVSDHLAECPDHTMTITKQAGIFLCRKK